MSISKEIFGIERKEITAIPNNDWAKDVGHNQALDLLDEYELSEEALIELLVRCEDAYIHNNPTELTRRSFLVKYIKQNQSKLFVRKNETT